MINASTAFHEAILQTNPNERALILFSLNNPSYGPVPGVRSTLMAWTSEDISAQAGLQIAESVNENREFSIGQTTSSTVSVSIFNDHGKLTDYMSQVNYDLDARVYLGVRTALANLRPPEDDALCIAYANYGSGARIPITGHSTAPYLRLAGVDITPSGSYYQFPVGGLIVEDNAQTGGCLIIAIGKEPDQYGNTPYYGLEYSYGQTWGGLASGTWQSLSSTSWGDLMGSDTVSTPSTARYMFEYKYPSIARRGLGYMIDGETVYEARTDGSVQKFEYALCGIFKFDKPSARNQYLIPFTAYDRMTRFDKDISGYLEGLTYPVTLFNLLDGLCTYCGVENAMNGSEAVILNASMSIAAAPKLTRATGRALLQYIAEAAGCNARMTRDGKLELCYYHSVPEYFIYGYPNASPYHPVYNTLIANYEVGQITGVAIDDPQEDADPVTVLVGTDSNVYNLSSNPLLEDEDISVVTTRLTPIYNRLSTFPPFPPITLDTICDWTVQAGDCVQLRYLPAGSDSVVSAILPVYTQTIKFSGIADVTYENRGSMSRPADSYAYGTTQKLLSETRYQVSTMEARSASYLTKTGNAYRALSIPFGQVDGTSTKKVFTAQIPGITELRDGVCAYIKNGVVTSASGCTLNINGLGAKPIYQTLAAASRTTTAFNIDYTMLFVYNSSRVDGGCWDMFYGYNTNTTYTNAKLGQGYGTCTTSVAAATVTLDSYTQTLGGIVAVKFENNLPASATLAINGTTAKAVLHRGAALTAGIIKAGDIATFVYDGTNYILLAIDRCATAESSAPSGSGIGYTTCSTAASTAAKTATLSGATQTSGTFLAVLFSNGNTAETPTFALNGGSALPLISCFTNAAISSTAITTGMTALMLCTGSAWVVLNPRVTSFLANVAASSANSSL